MLLAITSEKAINLLVNELPNYIKAALLKKSGKLECSLKATIEMAISSFLDEEAFSFEDCLLAQRLKDQDK